MKLTIKDFVLRGLAAGAAGGLAAALFIRFVTERQIGFALLFEDATGIGAAAGDPAEFSRSTQHWGGMAAALLYGAVLGMVLGVATAALHHRLRSRDEFGRVAKVAAGAFLATSIIPGMKYPANPPTVGDPDTISQRTTNYLLLMAVAILLVFVGALLWQYLTDRGFSGGSRFLLGGGGFVALVSISMLTFPASPDAINPPDSDAAPALEISASAPPEVLDQLLVSARATDDGWIRDPDEPTEPLDLGAVASGADLVGAPAAVSTTELVPHAYTTMVWHFRTQSIAGVALMWSVMAGALGLLLDRKVTELAAA